MYRQIQIDDRDLDQQCILWNATEAEPPAEYQLLTVTYDMSCAPFLTLRILRQLISDEGSRFSLAVPILKDHIYIDDVLSGGDAVTPLRETRD